MENKNSFVLYTDYIDTFFDLSEQDACNLIRLIFEYVNDRDPDESKYGPMVKIAFIPIKKQLKRDLVKWNETRGKRSEAGKASAEAKKIAKQQNQQMLTSVESVQQTSTKSTVNVNATVNVKEDSTDEKTDFPSLEDVIKFCDENGYTSDHAKGIFDYYDSQQWKDKNDQDISSKWKYQVRKVWFKDEGRKPLTNEERMQAFNNPPISKEFWDRLTRSEQHSYQVMHGGSGFPLKKA